VDISARSLWTTAKKKSKKQKLLFSAMFSPWRIKVARGKQSGVYLTES
jgi:hypothetical protein